MKTIRRYLYRGRHRPRVGRIPVSVFAAREGHMAATLPDGRPVEFVMSSIGFEDHAKLPAE